ncbi:hypothetical protein GCM10022393_00250 [Aquimarina addita]|uniref:Secretion system C-terminal sorting domain-containing protein n=1 Tax=Aquimarina addita TaxID=870485 RepID=A0ABP7X6V5_9FLAO
MKNLTLVITLLFNYVLFAQTFTDDIGITYTITSDVEPYTIEATDYDMSSQTLTIPDSVTNNDIEYTVTSIGNNAFENSALSRVDIPDSVISIGELAFQNNNLTVITIGSGVTNIGEGAFILNSSINDVYYKSLFPERFSDTLFSEGVSSSINLHIPEGSLYKYKVYGWVPYKFNSINVGLTSPSTKVFDVDRIEYTITSDTSPYTVEVSGRSIGGSEFRDVIIPDSATNDGITYTVTRIGENAFDDNHLTGITIPNTVTSIGDYAFFYNDFTEVIIPDSVTSIGIAAFKSNITLTNVTFGNGLVTIGKQAFLNTSLESVIIPDSVISIGEDAFLKWGNIMTSLTLGNSLTSIGEFAFGNSGLTSIIFPESLTSLGEDAFSGTTTISNITFENPTPIPFSNSYFDNISGIDLIIPTGTTDAYIEAGWIPGNFNSITESSMIPTPIPMDFTEDKIEDLSFVMNIFSNNIKVDMGDSIHLESLSVYNLSGERVLESKETMVSTADLDSGIYIVHINTNEGTLIKKFGK